MGEKHRNIYFPSTAIASGFLSQEIYFLHLRLSLDANKSTSGQPNLAVTFSKACGANAHSVLGGKVRDSLSASQLSAEQT